MTLALFVSLFLNFYLLSAYQFENSDFVIDVTADVNGPQYVFWLKSNETEKYHVTFTSLFEAIPKNGGLEKQTIIDLSTLKWSLVPYVNGTLGFNIVAADVENKHFSMLTLSNRIFNVTHEAKSDYLFDALKFDVEIDGYKWTSTEATAKLVLATKLTLIASDSHESQWGTYGVKVGNSYFDISGEATTDDETVVAVSLEIQKEGGFWIIYDHFNNKLFHDPEIGFTDRLSPEEPTPVWHIVVPIVVVLIFVTIGVAGFFYWRSHRRDYQSI